jgi:hypothetical protein
VPKGVVVEDHLTCIGNYVAIAIYTVDNGQDYDLAPALLHWNGSKWVDVSDTVCPSKNANGAVPASLYRDACLVS